MGKFSDALEKSRRVGDQPRETVKDVSPLEKADVKPLLPAPDSLITVADKEGSEDSLQPLELPPKSQIQKHSIEVPSALSNSVLAESLDKSLLSYHAPHSFEAEQFRMLRTNIMFPLNGERTPRSILITSALPGEGKSFIAANLAITIAQNIDRHVLLMDCDMRNPTIHKLFGIDSQCEGLSNYLTGGTPLSKILIRTIARRLSILPGGPPPPNPAELLSSNRMADLLREVHARYEDRYVIIDSPPPQLTAESTALAKFVEGVIIVVRFGSTDRTLVAKVAEQMGKRKLIGVVVNFLSQRAAGNYGSGKYQRYSYHQKPKK